MIDKYDSFAELAARETAGRDYRIRTVERGGSPVLVLAPHGGSIEVGTSELAELVAGSEHSLFLFEGLKLHGSNRDLHITSHRFDHPQCLELSSAHDFSLAIHGCRGESHIYIGGLDVELTALLGSRLAAASLATSVDGHRYPGRHPLNICNRSARARGAQLEITNDLRTQARPAIAAAVRAALADYLESAEPARRRASCN
jgi:phage replication-related protein YjqB (UPF0714/DUF867 family)